MEAEPFRVLFYFECLECHKKQKEEGHLAQTNLGEKLCPEIQFHCVACFIG